MISAIGAIIGIYVILRCLDVLCSAKTRYSRWESRAFMSVASCLVMLVTGFLLVGIFLGGTQLETPGLSFDPTSASPQNTDRKLTPEQRERNRRDAIEELRTLGK